MIILVVAVIAGCAFGVATGGRLSNLGRVRARGMVLIVAVVAGQVVAGLVVRPFRAPVILVCCAASVAWCVLNRHQRQLLPGMAALAAGLVTNAVVIAVNGGMPVSSGALGRAGLPARLDVSVGHLYKHVAMTGRSTLTFLGDIVPLKVFHMVASPGDVVMLAGLALVAWGATAPRHRRRPTPAVDAGPG